MHKLLLLFSILLSYSFAPDKKNSLPAWEAESLTFDSTKKYIQLIDIEVGLTLSPASNVPLFSSSVVKVPHCANVFYRDSLLHVYRKDFDTATKVIVIIRYDRKYLLSNGGDNTATYFLRKKEVLTVNFAFDSKKLFYKISADSLTITPASKKSEQIDNSLKAEYKVKKKDNNLVEYKITEIHKITAVRKIAFEFQDDFGCD